MIAPRHLVVPTDLSTFSLTVLRYAVEIADLFHARLTVLLVVDRHADQAHLSDVEREERARQAITGMLRELNIDNQCIGVLVRHGHAAPEIVRAAKEVNGDLIVMCTHGRTGMRHILVGSVAEKVVRASACPVLTMRPEEFREIVALNDNDVAGDLHLPMGT
jgi:nucleotide-binding universal stress UspA family protein